MLPSRRFLPIVAVIAALSGITLSAAEESKGVPSAEAIGELVKQLDADEFADRENASRELTEAGKAAIPALTEAATADALEVSTRSMRILRKLLRCGDEPTEEAARKALEKVAQSKHPSAAQAKEALRPAAKLPGLQPAFPGWQGGVINLARRISVKNVNGVKTINVTENNRKVKIEEDPKKGIKVEVTETKNGKQVTKVTEAKNADELKKKDRQAHDLYKQYGQGKAGGVIQVQIQVGGIPGGRIQIQPIIPRAVPQKIQVAPGRAKINSAKRVEMATRLLQHAGRQLQQAIDGAEDADELKEALGKFEQELKKQLAQIEKHRKPAK